MGSYLSFVNDTSDVWWCKDGTNTDFLKLVTQASQGFLPNFDWTVQFDGLLSNAVNSADGTVFYGVPKANLTELTDKKLYQAVYDRASVLGKVSAFDVRLTEILGDALYSHGFRSIQPGNEKKSSKYSLSLSKSGQCFKLAVVDEKKVTVDKFSITTMFSGATDKSVKKYKISEYTKNSARTQITGSSDAVPKAANKVNKGVHIVAKLKVVEDEDDDEDAEEDEDDTVSEDSDDEAYELVLKRSLREDDSRLLLVENGETRELQTENGAPLQLNHPALRQ